MTTNDIKNAAMRIGLCVIIITILCIAASSLVPLLVSVMSILAMTVICPTLCYLNERQMRKTDILKFVDIIQNEEDVQPDVILDLQLAPESNSNERDALSILIQTGFTNKQAEDIQDAIQKNRVSDISQYCWQFKTFATAKHQAGFSGFDKTKQNDNWKAVLEAFDPMVEIVKFNKEMAECIGRVPVSVTTIKPSPESERYKIMRSVCEGIHPHFEKKYIRTIDYKDVIQLHVPTKECTCQPTEIWEKGCQCGSMEKEKNT